MFCSTFPHIGQLGTASRKRFSLSRFCLSSAFSSNVVEAFGVRVEFDVDATDASDTSESVSFVAASSLSLNLFFDDLFEKSLSKHSLTCFCRSGSPNFVRSIEQSGHVNELFELVVRFDEDCGLDETVAAETSLGDTK